MQTNQFKTGLAQIAACEAQHASYFQTQTGGKPFWLSFPPALTIQQASDAMDRLHGVGAKDSADQYRKELPCSPVIRGRA